MAHRLAASIVVSTAITLVLAGCAIFRSGAPVEPDGEAEADPGENSGTYLSIDSIDEKPDIRMIPAPLGAWEFLGEPRPERIWAEMRNVRQACSFTVWAGYGESGAEKELYSEAWPIWILKRAAWSGCGRYVAYQFAECDGHQPYWQPITVLDLKTQTTTLIDDLAAKVFGPPGSVACDGGTWVTGPDEGAEDPRTSSCWSPDGRLHFAVLRTDPGAKGDDWWQERRAIFDPRSGKVEEEGAPAPDRTR